MNKEDILSIVPLLPAQQFMLSASLKGNSSEYIQQLFFEVQNVPFDDISRTIADLVESYECLRAHVLHEGLKQAVWVTLKNAGPRVTKHQCDAHEIHSLKEVIRQQGFNLQTEAALRFDWFETKQTTYLLITNHHILFDGWGKQQLLGDFIQKLHVPGFYLPPRSIKAWYDGWKALDHNSAQAAYHQYLLDLDQVAEFTEISGASNRSEITTFLEKSTLQSFAQTIGLTQAEFINFSWSCFMAGWTGNPNIQLGLVKQNGLIERVKNGFGLAIQTLPFQALVPLEQTPAQYLETFKIRERSITSFPYVDVTNEQFQRINYKVVIAFENYPINERLVEAAATFKLIESYGYSEFPISIAITPSSNQLTFQWHFNQSVHSPDQVKAISSAYMNYLEQVQDVFHQPIRQPKTWKAQSFTPPAIDGFFAACEKQLALEHRTTSYLELLDAFEAKNTARIWIYGDKHPMMDLLIIAAWKSRVSVVMVNEKESDAFVASLYDICPPDAIFTAYPDDRIPHHISLEHIDLNGLQASNQAKSSEVALSICTSGSTGTPKVVQLSLPNMVAFFEAWAQKLPWRTTEHFAVIAHPAFDIGVAELIFPLWRGWQRTYFTIAMLSDETTLISQFNDITAFHMVPALLEQWIAQVPSDQKPWIVMTGGDRVPPRIQQNLSKKFPAAELYQFYGPSECSVLATGFANKGQFSQFNLPLGSTFNHAQVLVFTDDAHLSSPFQEGEIVIAGPAVGLGYANDSLNPAFFKVNGLNAYRSGDRGYIDENGQLFFKGRHDNQVKINGQRIELTRIEQALVQSSGMEAWQIIYRAPILAAFHLGEEKAIPSKEALIQHLPAYAIPQWIIGINDFPVNKNGKIDTQALGLILDNHIKSIDTPSLPSEYIATFEALFPGRAIEQGLGWYANGFNSIDAMKLSGKIKKSHGQNLPLNAILTCLNLAQLPQLVCNDPSNSLQQIQVGNKVHDAAARMFFLSESDEKFAKTYWIHSAFRLPNHEGFITFLTQWVEQQKNLSLAIQSEKSSYVWTSAPIGVTQLMLNSEEEFTQTIATASISPFNHLVQLYYGRTETDHYLGISVHHGLLDGLGLQQVIDAFFTDYQANTINEITLLEPKQDRVEIEFWKPYLEHVQLKKLPFEREQPNTKHSTLRIELRPNQVELLQEWKKTYQCSTFEAGLIGWIRHWHRYFPQHFATGIVVSAQTSWEDHQVAAMSANTLPFVVLSEDPETILTQWRLLHKKSKQSFAEIAQLETNKQQQGTPFFNTSYVHNQWKQATSIVPLTLETGGSAFDVSLDFIEEGSTWIFQWEFDPTKFSNQAIQRFHESFFNGKEKEPQAFTDVLEEMNLCERWELIMSYSRDSIAIRQGELTITYHELNEQIQAIRKNITGRDKGMIPLLLERKPAHIAFLLAIMIEGIPFIPIDEETPKDRIKHIEILCGNPVHHVDNLSFGSLNGKPTEASLCYAIATSGTTGIPKLVGVKQTGYTAAIEAWKQQYAITSVDRILQAASFSFDVFLGDIGRSLFQGATLVLTDKFERKDPMFLLEAIEKYNITVFETTPLVVRCWLQKMNLTTPTLRLLIVGSDSWKIKEMESLRQAVSTHTKVISSYGLSETTIDNSFFAWQQGYAANSVVPIGQAMQHSSMQICDAQGKALPDGIEGLLCLDGPCVGLGYYQEEQWSHPSGAWLTADRGVKDEYHQFHFLGRSDQQVKIRGQRLELNEIERILHGLHHSKNWVAFTYDSGFGSELGIGYEGPLERETKQWLMQQITKSHPSYYLPSTWVKVDTFSMNQNGKINVIPLVDKASVLPNQMNDFIATGDQLARILQLIKHLFNLDVTQSDQFFSLGLSSFDAMYFVREWNERHDEKMHVFQLFSANDFSALAASISEVISLGTDLSTTDEFVPANPAQEAIWVEIQRKDTSVYNLPHFIDLPSPSEAMLSVIAATLRACAPLFVRFELSNEGVLKQIPIPTEGYVLESCSMDKIAYETFQKQSFFQPIDLATGPCFEAKLIYCEHKTILYFNPHHIVYDGGSDAALAQLFQQIQDGQKAKAGLVHHSFTPSSSWQAFFNTAPAPLKIEGAANPSLSPNYIQSLSKETTHQIKALQVQWRTSLSVVYSTLLGAALNASGVKLHWLSLVVDTRYEPCVGMHMRAFPVPVNPTTTPEVQVSTGHAALEFIYRNKQAAIQYPRNTDPSDFHQVGLIIQHPTELNEGTETEQLQVSRPRMPLSLYIDTLGEEILLRWEFDMGFFQAAQMETFHNALIAQINRFQSLPVNRQPFTISGEPEGKEHSTRTPGPITSLWEKYLGKAASNDFFTSGGTSLKALMMLSELERTFGNRIAVSVFMKDPTYETLANQLHTKPAPMFWEMQEGKEGTEWYFPPIFGLGLIFNSYPLTAGKQAVAFNYPSALGLEGGGNSINALADYLFHDVTQHHELPQCIDRIVAYSMGGLIAFEMIKMLEKRGIRVLELILWDKPAQLSYAPRNESTLHPELLEYAEQIALDDHQKTNIHRYLKHHQAMIEHCVQTGTINSEITLYYCQDGFDEQANAAWAQLTKGNFRQIALPKGLTHYEIPTYWKQQHSAL
jgi:non-ribosomal peptide synthetase component F/acyl carrier protein